MNPIDKNFFRYPDLAAWQADHDEGIIPPDAMVLVDKEGVVCRGNTVYRQIYVCPGNVQALTTASTPQQITDALGSFADFKAAVEAGRPVFFKTKSSTGNASISCALHVNIASVISLCAIAYIQGGQHFSLGVTYDASGWTGVNINNGSVLLKQTDVKDILTSTSATQPLSANQGRVLKGLIDGMTESALPYFTAEYDPDGDNEELIGIASQLLQLRSFDLLVGYVKHLTETSHSITYIMFHSWYGNPGSIMLSTGIGVDGKIYRLVVANAQTVTVQIMEVVPTT